MPKSAAPDTSVWWHVALPGMLAITGLRVLLLAYNRTDLFVDEAQYWLWGQDLAFGYYSKPPLIGWVIRASTDLAGSDAPFWVRLPAPLLHGVTAMILGAIAARIYGSRAAILVAFAYITLPMVALASLLISTDTVMFPFLAAALALYIRLLAVPQRPVGFLAGAALGLAALAKYAAVYYIFCAGLAAILLPWARPPLRMAALALLGFLVTLSPNLVWNFLNGFSTVQHTLDNADWVRDPATRAALNLGGLAEFFVSQFGVVGPVLFGALLAMTVRWRRLEPENRLILLFAVPIVVIVCGQALLAEAYANWAAAAYLAGTLCAVPWLMGRHRAWLIASFGFNGAVSLILPLSTLAADSLRLGDNLALERYVGRAELTGGILDAADETGLNVIVASDRDVLADLFYSGRYHPAMVYAPPPAGRAPHHYALKFPYPGGTEPVLFVTRSEHPVPCPAEAQKYARIAPESGAFRRHPQTIYVVPGDCFSGE